MMNQTGGRGRRPSFHAEEHIPPSGRCVVCNKSFYCLTREGMCGKCRDEYREMKVQEAMRRLGYL